MEPVSIVNARTSENQSSACCYAPCDFSALRAPSLTSAKTLDLEPRVKLHMPQESCPARVQTTGVNWGRLANRAANVGLSVGTAVVITGICTGDLSLVATGGVIVAASLVVKELAGTKKK